MGEKFFHNSKFCCLHPSSAWLRYRSGLVLWISNIANFFDLSNFVHVIVIYFIGQSGSSDKKNLILVKSWKRIVGSVTRKLSPNPTFIAKNPILQKSHLTFFLKISLLGINSFFWLLCFSLSFVIVFWVDAMLTDWILRQSNV